MKICKHCTVEKSLIDFRFRKDSCDGHAHICKKCESKSRMLWQQNNPEKATQSKARYYLSDKGKAQKQKEDRLYVLSGGRAKTEQKRALQPISDARKRSKLKSQLARRGLQTCLSDFDYFVLQEAISLASLRTKFSNCTWHVDHIIPISKGGTSEASNLQVVPALWNQQKSNIHTEKFFGNSK
jgi:hypothetical protein